MPAARPLPQLAPARVHEAAGPAAPAFALTMAGLASGPVIWIGPAHAPERLMPWAARRFLAPDRLLIVEAKGEADLLWATEEALRSGAAGFVIAAPEKPLSLTAGRRLQLAAEAGRTTGLLLIREDGGSNAAETRWHCAPLPGEAADSTRARGRLQRTKREHWASIRFTGMARRILSLWLPRLASEMSLRRRPHDGPFALSLRAGNADHLHCLNRAAEKAGLHRGMPLVDARAICPDACHPPGRSCRRGGLS